MTDERRDTSDGPPRYLARWALVLLLVPTLFLAPQPILAVLVVLLAAPALSPLFTQIDRLNRPLFRLVGRALSPVGRRLDRLLAEPEVPRRVRRFVTALPRRLLRVYAVAAPLVTLILVVNFFTGNPAQSGVGSLRDSACVRTSLPLGGFCGSGVGVVPLSTPEGETIHVGLVASGSGGPFDHTRLNTGERGVEGLIFAQDRQACAGPHITLAVATMLSRTAADVSISADAVGVEDLRGAYLAQARYNRDPGNRTKLCLVIANAGTRLTTAQSVPQVLKQLVLYSRHDPTFRGIVGFPFSGSAKNALAILEDWGQRSIPIVSPSATSDELRGEPAFHRVVSSDDVQSEKMVDFLVRQFRTQQRRTAHVAVFVDVDDAYSHSLATDFAGKLGSYPGGPSNIVATFQHYRVQDPESLREPVAAAVRQGADFIYFAGYAYDLDALESQLQGEGGARIPVLGGDGLYDLTRGVDNPYSIVYSTVYASPVDQGDPFVQEYAASFGSNAGRSAARDSSRLLPAHAILTYDATSVYLSALDDLVRSQRTTTEADFGQALPNVAFDGLSGRISFRAGSSDPQDKTVYVMCGDRDRELHLAARFVPGPAPEFPLRNVETCT